MDKRKIRVATRKSPLAIRQTEMAISELQELRPDWEFEVIRMSTTGDDRLAWSLETTGGKGLFTSALEEAIVNHKADLAVHSAKDLPTEMPEGVALVGFLPRAPACDVLVVRESVEEPTLIATSSPRRRAQLKKLFPKAAWKEIRGNVQTRLTKVSEGFADATVMAKAGLYRLGIDSWDGLRFEPISITDSVPAAGQGAIGLQIRSEDCHLYEGLLCSETARSVHLERRILAAMGGGCHSATAAHVESDILHVFDEKFGYKVVELSDKVDLLEPGAAESLLEELQS